MAERYNKNGIRILDDPKQANQIHNPKPCLPNMHSWREVKAVSNVYGGDNTLMRCRNCGKYETEVTDWDGNPI